MRNLTTQPRQSIRERLQAEIAALTNSMRRVDEEIREVDEENTSNTSGSNGADGVGGQSSGLEQPDGDARYTAGEDPNDDSLTPMMGTAYGTEVTSNTSPESPRRGVRAEAEDFERTLTNVTAPEVGSRDSIALPAASSSILAANGTDRSSTQSP
ncbi:hypothetical protein QFC24_006129 [Naganishia onofrii]|uniref:Uncharacterized protein n=1 Tax=Naganishia onofrii TaxID=1851511 RepID=A0ACC2X5Z9_9TREE|nr:hypothetical protein QFC24_006129 [Naganishia onofrii]